MQLRLALRWQEPPACVQAGRAHAGQQLVQQVAEVIGKEALHGSVASRIRCGNLKARADKQFEIQTMLPN